MGLRRNIGLLDPAEGLLDPIEVTLPRVVEHPQCNQIHARSHAHVSRIIAGDDARHVGAMRTARPIVIRIGVVFGKVPAPHHATRIAQHATERRMVVGDARVDHDDRLSLPGEPKTLPGRRKPRIGISVEHLLLDAYQYLLLNKVIQRDIANHLRSKDEPRFANLELQYPGG